MFLLQFIWTTYKLSFFYWYILGLCMQNMNGVSIFKLLDINKNDMFFFYITKQQRNL